MKDYLSVLDFGSLLTPRNGVVGLATGALGPILSKVYGGEMYIWFILVLFFAILFDWIGGSIAAKKDDTYSSAYGLQGIVRTAVLLALPAWGSFIDQIFGTNFIFFGFWGGVLFHTSISMAANFKRIGWNIWIPTWMIEWVAREIEAKIRRANSRLPLENLAINEQATTLNEGVVNDEHREG